MFHRRVRSVKQMTYSSMTGHILLLVYLLVNISWKNIIKLIKKFLEVITRMSEITKNYSNILLTRIPFDKITINPKTDRRMFFQAFSIKFVHSGNTGYLEIFWCAHLRMDEWRILSNLIVSVSRLIYCMQRIKAISAVSRLMDKRKSPREMSGEMITDYCISGFPE